MTNSDADNDKTPYFDQNDYEIVQRDTLYSGVFRLMRYHVRQRLFKGGWSEIYTREILERFSAAAVLPYDPVLDRVILIEQLRAGSLSNSKGPWLLEIPAGVLTGKETFISTAHQEAWEEAGCTLQALYPITEYYVSPGTSTEYLSVFCGKIDATGVGGIHGLAHEHEDIRVLDLAYHEALEKLQRGEIKTSPAIIALMWLQLNREHFL